MRVENLSVARGGVPVLEGINFCVEPGTALILRGPNGIGKTTLLRTLAGLQPAFDGVISTKELAYASHADGIKAQLSVWENLSFWAKVHGTGDVKEDVLSRFDLMDLKTRLAGHLSAGQKRRLGLARLAVTGASGFLLDEPTVSLDIASVEKFGAFIRSHLSSGGLAVLATHIDLGLEAETLDLTQFKADPKSVFEFDEAFL